MKQILNSENITVNLLNYSKSFQQTVEKLSDGLFPLLLTGVIDSQRLQVVAGIIERLDKSAIIVTHSDFKAQQIQKDLSYFLKEEVYHYPSKDIIFYSADVKSLDIIKNRFRIIEKVLKGEKIVIVANISALLDRLVDKEIFKNYVFDISVGDEISPDELCQKLVFMGYERTDLVEGQGQFALRGGILDIFPSSALNAVRLEFWGDEIDSLRLLDSLSQRSIENIETITILPLRELVYGEAELEKATKALENERKKGALPTKLKNILDEAIEKLRETKTFDGIDRYINYFYDNTVCLLDYFDKNVPVFFDEPSRIRESASFVLNEFTESIENRIDKGYMLKSQLNLVYSYEDIISSALNHKTILLTGLTHSLKDFKPKAIVDYIVKGNSSIKNNLELLAEDLKYMCLRGYKILFLAGGKTRCERILNELSQLEIPTTFSEDSTKADALKPDVVTIIRGSILSGFEYPEEKLAVLTDNELLTEEKKKKNSGKRKKKGMSIKTFTELKVGDYIVHESNGIGVFKGIEQIVSDGISKDYIKLGYANGGNLYITTNQLDSIQKYIGGDGVEPKLSRLGSGAWEKAKAKAKQAALILAQDLIALYAQRQTKQGFTYSPDTVWQREFEEAFEFVETEDQLNAIQDVKEDMENGKIMDRLICGDVGFGKTEVAIRAAFKTIQDGKQVAYLVPTTILARQHYHTFASRMENFPVDVQLLNRFKTPAEQKKTIEGLKKGSVDVVIGTHRLLSKDIKFKDLGLVIVDEEQRFGVGHKEKLKDLKKDVNVLTLTATPIPRTLHMSLTGIREMSILDEPPSERLPIQTYVMEYNDEFVRDAIYRELARGGQVYYLHNRVKNISAVMEKVQELVPEATVAYAHGQMSEKELEGTMLDFLDKHIDVLICTTIIETGLDIPNVNTIIIQDADKMGLGQLYQLRGRVGRSNRSSFCYLMYKKDKVLTEVSEKRLQTIKEFTEFGSGFRIAMRDLEIRGAGNLLGAEQHGHMDSVGYEMYCKLLDEAIHELRGDSFSADFETLMDLNINAYIPDRYIRNEEQKLEMYKRISLIGNKNDFYDVQDELEDRFGTMPNAVSNLLDIAFLKATAHQIGVLNISQKGNNILITFKTDANVSPDRIIELSNKNKGKFLFTAAAGNPYLTVRNFEKLTEAQTLAEISSVLDFLTEQAS